MDLSDSEKRDLINLIENNKPLPEQYRFKLFQKNDEIELLWNGKSNEITNVNLPFQIIEHVDEPRKNIEPELQGNLFDDRGRKQSGWTNKLIWGNNSLVLSSLINGQFREEIEKQGGLKLVYIDPPFNVGDDFEFEIEIGKERFSKKRNALEQLAYSDTWGKGEDSFLSMLYERLKLIKNLLSADGLLLVHCDLRTSALIKIILDEIFGDKNYINSVCWKRTFAHGDTGQGAKHLGRIQDHIHIFSKSDQFNFNNLYVPYDEKYVEKVFKYKDNDGRRWQSVSLTAPGGASKGNAYYEFMGVKRYWQYSIENMQKLVDENKIYQSKEGSVPRRKFYLDESKGVPLQDIWNDIAPVQGVSKENVSYPTQKPEKFIDRIIKLTTNENDLVADFFCGSGTTLAVAEKLNRKWIGCDLGKFAIHTSRKRLIQVQREKETNGQHFRPFEVLNLGKYQREFFFKDYLYNERNIKNDQSEEHYYDLILKAYKGKKKKAIEQ
jgi:adenine-specific DNA-methyltransferase